MKSLLELEKEIPATVLAAGDSAMQPHMNYIGLSERQRRWIVAALKPVYAAMQYEQQLLIAGQQKQIRDLKLERAKLIPASQRR